MTKYIATGIVWGNCWGGGQVGYQSERLEATTLKDLYKQINKGIENGSLDSGMGYESLEGAIMNIEIRTTKIIDGKEFINSEYNLETFGNIDEKTQDFLIEAI